VVRCVIGLDSRFRGTDVVDDPGSDVIDGRRNDVVSPDDVVLPNEVEMPNDAVMASIHCVISTGCVKALEELVLPDEPHKISDGADTRVKARLRPERGTRAKHSTDTLGETRKADEDHPRRAKGPRPHVQFPPACTRTVARQSYW